MLLVTAIVVVGLWCATQWTAAELGFQMRLGAPWIRIYGYQVYYPWRFLEWWYVYESYAPAIFNRGGAIFASSGLIAWAHSICVMTGQNTSWLLHRRVLAKVWASSSRPCSAAPAL